MSDEVVNKDGALVVDMAQADALWNSLDPIKRAELTNMMFEPVLAKAKQQADRIEGLETKLRQSELREAAMKSANEEARKFLREKSAMVARIEELEAAVKLNQDLDAISLDYVSDLEAKLAKAVEALSLTRRADDLREAYHRLPNDKNRIGDKRSKKSHARDAWLRAFRKSAKASRATLAELKGEK